MLSDRNILLVAAARFVSRVGGTAAFFIGTWGTAAYTFDATPQQLAYLAAANAIMAIVGSIVAGVLIDRIGPRNVLIGAELLSAPAVLAMVFAETYPVFVMFSAAFALVGVPTWTAGAAFAPYLVEGREKLEKVNALIEGASSVGFILGPAIGALISTVWGLPAVFGVMAVAALIAAALAWGIRIQIPPVPADERMHPWLEFKHGLRVSYATRSLRYFIAMGTAMWFGFGAFAALEPLFFRDVVGVGVEWIGYMNTLFGLGMVAGAALLPRLPAAVVGARGLAVGTALVGLGSVGYVGTADLRFIAVGALAWGLVIGGIEPLLRTLIHLDAPHEYVGRVVGTAQYHRNAGELIPLALAPALAVAFGVQAVLIGGGVMVALIALAGSGVARAIDRDRRAAAAPPVALHLEAGSGTVGEEPS